MKPRSSPGRDLADALGDLPIFPLPQAVLFPGARMPLHVFEPRYRRMTRDAIDTNRAMAVAHIVDPVELDAEGNPRVSAIAGVGAIVDWQELPDGRLNIVLEGRGRVRLAELPFVPPYRRARAELLEDAAAEVPKADQAALVAIANAFVAFVQTKDQAFQFTLAPSLPAPRVADLCAHHLILDARERQSLLESLDPAARVRRVAEAIATQLAVFRHEPPSALN